MYEKLSGTGRPLVIYNPSILKQGKNSMYPSILRYLPCVPEFPEELIRTAMDLKKAENECREYDQKFNDLRNTFYDARYDDARVDELRPEMEECKVQEEALHKNLIAKRSEFVAAAISHSQTYCRSVSSKVVGSLPREVRDMIYIYMCDRMPRVSISPVKYKQTAPWRGPDSMQEAETAGWSYIHRIETPLPQLFSHKYLQKDFLFELAESLYQTATFHVWDADDIFDFLNQDLLGAGCTPKHYIRKLSLVAFTDEHGSRCRSKRQIREKVAQLAHLLDIRHRSGFHLDLHLCINRRKLRPNVARFHQLLLPHLRGLLEAGFALRFPRVKYHYDMHRRSDMSRANQLQASDSRNPTDWVVDEAELDAWDKSDYVRDAFKKSAIHRSEDWWASESDGFESEFDYEEDWGEEDLLEDFVDGDVDSDDEGGVCVVERLVV
ncbi:hypothetical protein PMIN07_010288 [Paraphaeosphaeria minitans]